MENDKVAPHVLNVCRIGQGADCCKYLVMGAHGFKCMKINESTKVLIDDNWVRNHHVAQGDNCDGITSNLLNK